ncbi:DUF4013 domain-containing protein [uncultured Methanospirillum sp.]|uniref:DUF4013 domain-containing protein n=1 Tax=uncultured Methanospirillum sp. TaxID=262503 RepID=UPI0037496F9D
MSIGERISDPFYYVWEGIVKKPIIWVILTVFCFGGSLWGFTSNIVILKYISNTKPVLTYYPDFFTQYPLETSVACFIAGTILLLFLAGYTYQVFHGITPAPEMKNWGFMLINGLKVTVISFVYFIIPILVACFLVVLPLCGQISSMHQLSGETTNPATTPEIFKFFGIILGGSLISFLVFIVFWIFSIIGIIRFCRTGSMSSAFELSEVLEKIRNIGWTRYLGSLMVFVIIMVFFGIIKGIISLILLAIGFVFGLIFKGTMPVFIGISMIIALFIQSLIAVYSARYFSVLYDADDNSENLVDTNSPGYTTPL